MKNRLFAALALVAIIALAGCTMADLEKGAEKTEQLAEGGEKLASVTLPFTGPYGPLAIGVLGAIGYAAGAVRTFAKGKAKGAELAQAAKDEGAVLAKALAQAAVEAADQIPGGGKALVMTATANGVAPHIKEAHKANQ